MSLRSQSRPYASILARWAGVIRIEKCSSLSSGNFGGRPILGFVGSMCALYNMFLWFK